MKFSIKKQRKRKNYEQGCSGHCGDCDCHDDEDDDDDCCDEVDCDCD